jgi:hypothetical protein
VGYSSESARPAVNPPSSPQPLALYSRVVEPACRAKGEGPLLVAAAADVDGLLVVFGGSMERDLIVCAPRGRGGRKSGLGSGGF